MAGVETHIEPINARVAVERLQGGVVINGGSRGMFRTDKATHL